MKNKFLVLALVTAVLSLAGCSQTNQEAEPQVTQTESSAPVDLSLSANWDESTTAPEISNALQAAGLCAGEPTYTGNPNTGNTPTFRECNNFADEENIPASQICPMHFDIKTGSENADLNPLRDLASQEGLYSVAVLFGETWQMELWVPFSNLKGTPEKTVAACKGDIQAASAAIGGSVNLYH